jgi:hypothetical protein
MFIDVDSLQGDYHYMAGLLSTYKEADDYKNKIMEEGFPDARVIAYLDGIRIKESDIPTLALTYPDLLFYQSNNKK